MTTLAYLIIAPSTEITLILSSPNIYYCNCCISYNSWLICGLRVAGLHVRSGAEDLRMTAETNPVAPPSSGEAEAYDSEYARMEAWLDEHPDFVQDYFLR